MSYPKEAYILWDIGLRQAFWAPQGIDDHFEDYHLNTDHDALEKEIAEDQVEFDDIDPAEVLFVHLHEDGSLELFSDPPDGQTGARDSMGTATRQEIYRAFGMTPQAPEDDGPGL